MAAVHFYHLTTTPLERALPKLLERSYSGGFRTMVVADEARIDRLNEWLWTYEPDSFLPHGSVKDCDAGRQPILICHSAASVSESAESSLPVDPALMLRTPQDDKKILIITNGVFAEDPAPYDRVIDMFDGAAEESLGAACARWKRYKDAGCELHYYQQTASGGWDKKAA